jgi:hypothetical protein
MLMLYFFGMFLGALALGLVLFVPPHEVNR